MTEFIGPLSLCLNTLDDQYEEFKTFTDFISGDGTRRKTIENLLKQGDGGGGDSKKKKGKGKKKRWER